ncbi:metal-dependent transcriptional regulator [candidate division FCPU426 bacterium]|nr:metal-dependent transcriptional regulator [candidate division FCPU426 bacterium]
MKSASGLSASLEDYLEAIYYVFREKQGVRAKDVARRLRVKAASVTGALRLLANREMIRYSPYDVITLTARGKNVAQDIARRHEVLEKFFIQVLDLDKNEADEAACKMEHAVSSGLLQRLVLYVQFVEQQSSALSKKFKKYCTRR